MLAVFSYTKTPHGHKMATEISGITSGYTHARKKEGSSSFSLSLKEVNPSQNLALHIVVHCSVAQLHPTLCNPMDCTTPVLLPSLSSEVCPSSCPLHQWCHPDISSSDTLFYCPTFSLVPCISLSRGAILSPHLIQSWWGTNKTP